MKFLKLFEILKTETFRNFVIFLKLYENLGKKSFLPKFTFFGPVSFRYYCIVIYFCRLLLDYQKKLLFNFMKIKKKKFKRVWSYQIPN